MRQATSMLLALLASPALAGGTITFRGPGTGMEAPHAFIDGDHVGQVRQGRKGLAVVATSGAHEVWLAHDEAGVITWCRGVVQVPADGDVAVSLAKAREADLTCQGTQAVRHDDPSASQGASVAFALTRGLGPWLSVDGASPTALPKRPFLLNLAPGPHDIVLFEDVQEDVVIARERVELTQGDALWVACTIGGCTGLRTQPDPVARSER